jgi:hypothetical protein
VALRRDAWPGARVEQNVWEGALGATAVFVRPSRYERGRAFVAVYNRSGAPAVRVSLAGLATPGQRYELRNVQDVFGAPVAAGVYSGDSVTVPMAGVAPPLPVGRPGAVPPRTAPYFDVFLVTVSAAPSPSGTLRSPAR